MRPLHGRALTHVCLTLLLMAASADASETSSSDRAVSEATAPVEASSLGVEKQIAGIDWVVMPVPIANPTIGTGLTGTIMGLYRIGAAKEASITALAAFRTDNDSQGVGVFQQAYLGSSRWVVNAALARATLNLDLYGDTDLHGSDAVIAIQQEMKGGAVWALARFTEHASVGLRYRFDEIRTRPQHTLEEPPPILDDADLELALQESTIELLFEYDTRDTRFWPTRGWFIDASSAFTDEAIGSDISYRRHSASATWHRSLRPTLVLAIRASACGASESAPFFATCLFGQSSDLRGYVVGRYRGEAMAVTQMELRWRPWRRFGAVVFAGMGDVADSFGKLRIQERWSAGAGLRYLASAENNLNVGVDVSYAESETAVYFRIGEAF